MLRTHLLGSGAYIFPGMVSAIDQSSGHRRSSVDGSQDLGISSSLATSCRQCYLWQETISSVTLAMRACSRPIAMDPSPVGIPSWGGKRRQFLEPTGIPSYLPMAWRCQLSGPLVEGLRSGRSHDTLGTGSQPPLQPGYCSQHRPRGTRRHNHHTEPRPLSLLGAGSNKGLHRAPRPQRQGQSWCSLGTLEDAHDDF